MRKIIFCIFIQTWIAGLHFAVVAKINVHNEKLIQKGNDSMTHASHYRYQQYSRQGNHGTITDEEVLTHDMVMSDYYTHDQDKMNVS